MPAASAAVIPPAPMSSIHAVIRAQPSPEIHPAIRAVCDDLRTRFGDAIEAVLYYGSCLRQGDPTDGVIDLYVIVSDYRAAWPTWGRRLIARFLPPTVGYLETPWDEGCIRTKYAVISQRDFRRGTSGRWFHSYLWARFSQPCVLLETRDDEVSAALTDSLATAVVTLLDRSVPLAPSRIDAVALWSLALGASYRAELRPESSGRAESLVADNAAYYDELTRAYADGAGRRWLSAVEASGDYVVSMPPWRHRRGRMAWFFRRLAGKFLSTFRWFKAAVTFEGGIDYAVWKLERHTGVKIEVTEKLRKRPWLYAWGEIIRLYRSGTLR